MTDKGLKSAYRGAEKHNWNEEELEAYNKVWMKIQDEKGHVTLEVRKAVAQKEKEKIKALAEKEKDMALKFLDLGVSTENISKATGLTIKEIKELKTRKS